MVFTLSWDGSMCPLWHHKGTSPRNPPEEAGNRRNKIVSVILHIVGPLLSSQNNPMSSWKALCSKCMFVCFFTKSLHLIPRKPPKWGPAWGNRRWRQTSDRRVRESFPANCFSANLTRDAQWRLILTWPDSINQSVPQPETHRRTK